MLLEPRDPELQPSEPELDRRRMKQRPERERGYGLAAYRSEHRTARRRSGADMIFATEILAIIARPHHEPRPPAEKVGTRSRFP
jgi:hypothetical protein